MPLESEEGLILRVRPHAEADRLVTWYGAENGRITALAKGAAKSRKRFVNKLEPFTRLRFFYRPPRHPGGLHFLEDAELLEAHLRLRLDWRRFLAAGCIAEPALRFTRDQDADPALYALLRWALEATHREARFLRFPLFFHFKLLQAVGYRPDLTRCRRCGRVLDRGPAGPVFFAPGQQEAGGAMLLCAGCHASVGQGRAGGWEAVDSPVSSVLAPQTWRLLLHIQQTELPLLTRLHAPDWSIAQGMDVAHHFSQQLLQSDLAAWPVLRQVFFAYL